MQNGDWLGEHLVNLVPTGGENLNYGTGDEDQGQSGGTVPGQPIQVQGHAQGYI